MLKKLKLKNLALIEIIEINFEKGLNVFTGESGSGKSLIVDSLNSLFGGTNIPLHHLIRPGENECLIQANFRITPFVRNFLANNNQIIESNELTIARNSFIRGSKIISKFTVNEKFVKKKFLENLGCLLVDFAGQNDTLLFGSQEYLRNILDETSSKELKELKITIQQTYTNLRNLQRNIDSKLEIIRKNKENHFANTKILQILEEANLTDDQEILLLKSRQLKLANNYELISKLNLASSFLSDFSTENSCANTLISEAVKQLNRILKYDNAIQDLSDKLINSQAQIEEVVLLITNYLESIDNEENNLEEVQARLYKLQNLEKTFSLDLSSLIYKRNELRKLSSLDRNNEELASLKIKFHDLDSKFQKLLKKQSLKRQAVAVKFEKLVSITLRELGLDNAKFAIKLKKIEPTYHGSDFIKFLFSANPDQDLAPISSVISGGEMSRFLLALKFNLSKFTNTIFFDEIDNGLSGKSLLATINLIKKISSHQQTLCITHNPLLASSADTHFKVQKSINGGLTTTTLKKLTTIKEKQNELAELIGGGYKEASNYALTLINKAAA